MPRWWASVPVVVGRGERNLVWKSGGTYYVLNRTEILPIAVPLTWVGLNTTARNLSDALRPTIDEAYDNPEQGHGIGTSDVGSKDSPSVTQASRTPAHEALPVKAENTSETRDVEHEHRTAAEVSATAPPSEEGAPPSVEKSESTVSRAALASKEDERAARARAQKPRKRNATLSVRKDNPSGSCGRVQPLRSHRPFAPISVKAPARARTSLRKVIGRGAITTLTTASGRTMGQTNSLALRHRMCYFGVINRYTEGSKMLAS